MQDPRFNSHSTKGRFSPGRSYQEQALTFLVPCQANIPFVFWFLNTYLPCHNVHGASPIVPYCLVLLTTKIVSLINLFKRASTHILYYGNTKQARTTVVANTHSQKVHWKVSFRQEQMMAQRSSVFCPGSNF